MEYAGYLLLLVPLMGLTLVFLGKRFGFFWWFGVFALGISTAALLVAGYLFALIFKGYPRL